MIQIRFHGRGGQGVVTSAELTAIAAFFDGNQAQAFPAFGVERTGAPIEAFARIDDKPIRTRQHIQEPDIIVVLDASLLDTVNVAKGAKNDTLVVINTAKSKQQIATKLKIIPPNHIFTIDATRIALDIIGKNIANTVILGALARQTQLISLKSLKQAIKQKFKNKGKEIINKNIKAIEAAYNEKFE